MAEGNSGQRPSRFYIKPEHSEESQAVAKETVFHKTQPATCIAVHK